MVSCRAPTALNQCLTVLEHASFACPANEQHLVGLAMQPAADSSCQVPPQQHSNGNQSSAAQPFADWLVHQVQQMQLPDHSSQGDTLQPDWVCIQSALSVLINMTHNNQVGCQAVVTAGGMQMAVCMISQSIQRQELGCKPTDHLATPGQVRRQDRQHVLTDVGPITAALGLLINLVEDCTESRQQMKSMRPAENGADTNMLELLCRLMQASCFLASLLIYLQSSLHRLSQNPNVPVCLVLAASTRQHCICRGHARLSEHTFYIGYILCRKCRQVLQAEGAACLPVHV